MGAISAGTIGLPPAATTTAHAHGGTAPTPAASSALPTAPPLPAAPTTAATAGGPASTAQASSGAAALAAPGTDVAMLIRQLTEVLQRLTAAIQALSGAQALGGGASAPTGPTLAHGTLQSAGKMTSGTATVVATAGGGRELDLTNFATESGPALHAYLVPTGSAPGDVSNHIDLGALQGTSGNQRFTLPPGADLSRYGQLVIWCEQAKVPFGTATLTA